MASVHKRVSERTGAISWQVKYRTPDGQARSKTCKTQKEALREAREIETKRDDGTFVDPHRAAVSVAEWAAIWLASKANLKPTTRSRNADVLRKYITPKWSGTKLSQVRHEEVQTWLNGLDLAPATVRKIYGVFSQALDYAVRSDRLARNPAKGVSLPRVEQGERRYLTHGQVATMAELVPAEWRLLVLFLAYTGLRWGEAAALTVSRLDLLRRRVIVAESVTPVNGVMTWGTPKGHERREVPIPKFLAKELECQIEGKGPESLLFTGPRGAVLRAGTFRRAALIPAAEKMGLCEPKLGSGGRQEMKRGRVDGTPVNVPVFTKHFHPHEFRHTAASLAIASGADVKVVQQMLGHKSATMTLDLYGHLFPDRLDVVADAMEQARTAALASG